MRSIVSTSKQRKGQRGQSLVEFALVLPVLLILVFGIIDFSMGLRAYVTLTNATREGARFGALSNSAGAYPTDCTGSVSTSVVGRVCTTMNGLSLSGVQSVGVSYPSGKAPGNSVVVSANYRYNFISPLGDMVRFFSGGAVNEYIDMSSSSDMRIE